MTSQLSKERLSKEQLSKERLSKDQLTKAQLTKEQWDQLYLYGHFANQWHNDDPSAELAGVIAANFSGQSTAMAIDVGCGAGTDAIFLARYGFEVTAVDLSSKAIEIASARAVEANVKVNWLVSNILDITLPEGCAQLINDRWCFHHIAAADRQAYSHQIGKMLALNGLLILRGSLADSNVLNRIDQSVIDRYFPAPYFQRGAVILLNLPTNGVSVPSSLVVIRKMAQ